MIKDFSRGHLMSDASAAAITDGGAKPKVSFDACVSAAGYAQKVVIHGFDWGPAVTATIIQMEDIIRSETVRAEDFAVVEKKESFDWAAMSAGHIVVSTSRKVMDAYACTSQGERTAQPSRYIRLEMDCDPITGSPFCYDFFNCKNTWCAPYELEVSLADDAVLTTLGGSKVACLRVAPVIDFDKALIPQLDSVDLNGKITGSDGKELRFAYYVPKLLPGQKAPLVIWLHGAGEGGTDTRIALLGNKVTSLIEERFQSVMGGAYVLVPQTPWFWLEYDQTGHWQDNPGAPSVYTKTLMELIRAFVEKFPVDINRILIGGCSNGGYMTMNMVLRYPDFFAAAYPICEAYKNSGITDEELERIKHLPIWFVYAQNDTVVPPADYEKPTIARLRGINPNLRTSVFEDVHDTSGIYAGKDGASHCYQGHWSWIYFFNNDCVDDATKENLWSWLARQSR